MSTGINTYLKSKEITRSPREMAAGPISRGKSEKTKPISASSANSVVNAKQSQFSEGQNNINSSFNRNYENKTFLESEKTKPISPKRGRTKSNGANQRYPAVFLGLPLGLNVDVSCKRKGFKGIGLWILGSASMFFIRKHTS